MVVTNAFDRGEPTGRDIKIGNYDAYLATPDPTNAHKDAAILYCPDVIGIWQNSKLMADQYAANGYLCIVIDLFNGDALPENFSADFDLMKWLAQGSTGDNPHTAEAIDPIVAEAIKWLKSEKGIKKLGAVGYCYGAKVRPILHPLSQDDGYGLGITDNFLL